MRNSQKNIANIFNKRHNKDSDFKAQLAKVYNALLVKPMTFKEADVYLANIYIFPQSNQLTLF